MKNDNLKLLKHSLAITVSFFILGALVVMPTAFSASDKSIVMGKDYEILSKPMSPLSGENVSADKVDVTEFFSFVCGACYNFENPLENWVNKNKSKINFSRSPYVYPDSGLGDPVLGEIYYTLEIMGKADEMMIPVYKAIQEQRLNFKDEKALSSFLSKNDVDAEMFAKTRSSFGVKTSGDLAHKRIVDAQVDSTPQIIVDGRYRVISGSSFERVLEVADALVTRVKFEKKRKSKKSK